MEDCVFCKIVKGELPTQFEYQDETVAVFPDLHPDAALHLLIIPKEHLADFIDLKDEKIKIWEKMTQVVQQLINDHGLVEKGYRLILNGGPAKLVNHLHWHLMGGITVERKL